ncbi:surfeit locus protein 6 [Bombina bombina]|uniref:surfeit locus protein 6 n=1 Tax=Bombina bombina TaxID=8345 RepID=UPI00235B06EB|nr:surfeit locus protein 6 [Bombina bombina]
MASLASKDSYFQSLGRKVCAQQNTELRKRKPAFSDRDGASDSTQPRKKKKKKSRKSFEKTNQQKVAPFVPPKLVGSLSQGAGQSSFSTVDILRKRLHEKLQESRGQTTNKNLSPEEVEKIRQRRKQERERKKKKKKEMRMKAAQPPDESAALPVVKSTNASDGKKVTDQAPLIFNKVEIHEGPLNKVMHKKEKKERVKGNITPLTGKNYKQLLSRLEARKNKLEDLKAKDEKKAKNLEVKMKWTNVLYKAEGVKIKDDEEMLKTALKRKEKNREQRKKHWDKRTENTAERMQQRQDKRQRNIQKKKNAKLENKKSRARKKGRILPEDLAKANLK